MNATILKYVFLLSVFCALHNTSLTKNIRLCKNRKIARTNILGTPAQPNQFPYAVSLQQYSAEINFYYHICTFSLITTQSILGAANCVVTPNGQVKDVKSFRGILGTVNRYNRTHKVTFKEFRPYPNFTMQSENDIAIAILSRRVKLGDSIKTIPIVRRKYIFVKKHLRTLGWGLAIVNGSFQDSLLLYLDVEVKSNEVCENPCPSKSKKMCDSLGATTFCYGPNKIYSFCIGVFGGPVIVRYQNKDVQIGITSNVEVTCTNYPSLSVIPDVYKKWIKTNAEGKVIFRNFKEEFKL